MRATSLAPTTAPITPPAINPAPATTSTLAPWSA
ncbi:Uncharacterised protein [Mycobacteroides abscessus subsp. abscessus]|nr:Uncharacterised protein [Mycobacteroides abscessus subsp. abscessus]